MPFTIRMEQESGVVIGTGTDNLGLVDAKDAAAALWGNPDWVGKPVLWDFRAARLDVRPSEVRELAQFILSSQPQPPPRVAIVTARDLDFGFGRMFEVLREHPSTEVRTFRDYDEAISWVRENP